MLTLQFGKVLYHLVTTRSVIHKIATLAVSLIGERFLKGLSGGWRQKEQALCPKSTDQITAR